MSGKWALFLALSAILNPGDEVLYLEPVWVILPADDRPGWARRWRSPCRPTTTSALPLVSGNAKLSSAGWTAAGSQIIGRLIPHRQVLLEDQVKNPEKAPLPHGDGEGVLWLNRKARLLKRHRNHSYDVSEDGPSYSTTEHTTLPFTTP